MHVTLRQLTVLEAVARNLSYTKAADELHLTQPAVSMQIKQIEESVGIPLFEQIGKKIFLTQAGKEMYNYARSIQQLISEAETVIEDIKGIKHGTLTIAVASTANYFAPQILAAFKERYGGINFSLDVTNREGLLQHLENNDTDMVIMGQPPRHMDLESEFFMENPLVAIAPPDHPMVGRRNIPMDDFLQHTFIVREQGSGTRTAIERFFSDRGKEMTTSMSMSSNEAIKQAVQAGLGLGVVSIHTLDMELELKRLAVLEVESFPILRNWYIVHRKGKRLSPAAISLKKFITHNAKNIIH
ncbi:MAG: LysR family transcriptional regulator [Gammaproteobacteria bacterium]|nr:LysR family transcriptional regulator [Gammaproteobacteria bacterium]MDH5800895.1 LysR family transcriptional regulator [Gammaproteobacteria bacterium]